MNVSIAYWGRVYDSVMYRGWTTLEVPADVAKITEAKSAVEDALSKKYPEGILDTDSRVEVGMNARYVLVECCITVLECAACGGFGHKAELSTDKIAWVCPNKKV